MPRMRLSDRGSLLRGTERDRPAMLCRGEELGRAELGREGGREKEMRDGEGRWARPSPRPDEESMGGPGGQGGERVKDAGDDWSGHDTSLGVAHLVGLMMDRIGSPESRVTSSQSSLSSCESHSYALGALRECL